MQITDEHEQRAAKLVAEVWWDREDVEPSPAFRGYLAAVKRIETDAIGVHHAPGGLGEDDPHDEPGHSACTLAAGSEAAGVTLTVGTEYEHGEETLSPEGARALAYELLVLADLTELDEMPEAATPEGGEDPC